MKAPPFPTSTFSRDLRWAGYSLGLALGGFFDGILLHQILQWHHLLSGLDGGKFDELRFQILADGLFHLLMYVVGGVGLWLLWRSRLEFGLAQADRFLAANALIGFGSWHIIDAIASHWVLGIHRIKMDADLPLVWDVLWFSVFGIAFVAWGWRLRPKGPGPRGRISVAPGIAASIVIMTGAIAAVPPSDSDGLATVVVFRPGSTPSDAMAATASVGGRLIWSDRHDAVWVLDLPPGANTAGLYRQGALLVSSTVVSIGCLNWFEPPKAEA
jgi:uncharacterized membrane protein